MRLWRRKREPIEPQPAEPLTLYALVLRDGMATAVNKGATRERVPDIAPHRFTPSHNRFEVRCSVCYQPEDHELHAIECPECGRPL